MAVLVLVVLLVLLVLLALAMGSPPGTGWDHLLGRVGITSGDGVGKRIKTLNSDRIASWDGLKATSWEGLGSLPGTSWDNSGDGSG